MPLSFKLLIAINKKIYGPFFSVRGLLVKILVMFLLSLLLYRI